MTLIARLNTAVLLLLAATAVCAADAEPADLHKYGKRLVASYDFPAETLEKLNGFQASKPGKYQNQLEAAATADTVEWASEPFQADAQKNPYKLVVTLKGKAVADGPVTTLWQAGWRREQDNFGFLPLTKPQAAAGEALTLVAEGAPVSFKESQPVAAMLNMVKAENIRIESVQVRVFGGLPEPGWKDWLFNLRWFLIAAIVIGLRLYFRRS